MSTISNIKGIGFVNTNNQLEVKSTKLNSKFNKNKMVKTHVNTDVSEYLLSGFIAFVEAIAQKVALEENLILKSLQLEVSAVQHLEIEIGNEPRYFFPFQKVEISLLPSSIASSEILNMWIDKIVEFINLPNDLLELRLSEKLNLKNIA